MYNSGWPPDPLPAAEQANLQQTDTQHKSVVACLIDWLHDGRKEKMQWVPSCYLTLLLLMLQTQQMRMIKKKMRTMTMPSATEAILYKMTIHPKQSCRTQMGSLYAPGGAIGIAALGRWRNNNRQTKGASTVWNLNRNKGGFQSNVWLSQQCYKKSTNASCVFTFSVKNNKHGSPKLKSYLCAS